MKQNGNKNEFDRWGIVGLIVMGLCVFYFALVEYFPFQDVPQHLAYGKIMGTFGESANRFSEFYRLPRQYISYHTTHHFLAFFESIGWGVEVGFRILLFLYFIVGSLSYILFIRVMHQESWGKSCWRLLFIPLIIFNATAGMGFMPFVIGMPLLFAVLACSHLWENSERVFNRYFWFTWLILIGASLLHVVLPFFFGAILLVYHFDIIKSRKYWIGHVLWAGTVLLCAYLWGGFRSDVLMRGTKVSLGDSFAFSYGYGFINQLFKIDWTNPFVMFNYVSWNFVGTFRLWLLVPFTILLIGCLYCVRKLGEGASEEVKGWSSKQKRVCLFTFILGVILPWGIYAPSEITFINYRFTSFALFLILGFFPIKWTHFKEQRVIITVYCLIQFGFYGLFTYLYQTEARAADYVLKRIPPKKKLASIVLHDKSDYFAKILDLTHFMPMYYTIRYNGLNSQFWARYTKHLPVEYRRGKRVNGPPDWKPWQFKKEHLEGVDYVILQMGGDPKRTAYSQKLYQAFRKVYPELARKENWVVFQVAN